MAHQPVGDSQTITTSATSARVQFAVQTDSEINEEDKLMDAERAAGLIPPSEQELQVAQMAMDAQNSGGNLGKPVNEPEVDTSKTEDPDSPGTPDLKGGEI